MPNETRHVVGGLVGLVASPVLLALVLFGWDHLLRASVIFDDGERYVGSFLMAVAAVGIGLLAGSRISPIASLIAGATFTGIAGLDLVARDLLVDVSELLPTRQDSTLVIFAANGFALLIGVLLLVSSIPPSRWRSRAVGTARAVSPVPPAGYHPAYAPTAQSGWPPAGG